MAALPGGTVTFLLTDIEGSSRMWDSGGDEQVATAVARHYEILDSSIVNAKGHRPQEQGEGDSVVAAFARPSDAARAAIEAQLALQREPWPTTTPLRVRMAIHTGEAQLRDEANYFGPSIIRCARLRELAHGGQIVVSAASADVLGEALSAGASLHDLGSHRLRDLSRPERVFQLCHADLPSDFPALKSLDSRPNNLPAQVTSFIGRVDEMRTIAKLLADDRLVTLTGSGGSGKTRLALQVAADRLDHHPDGVWWVDLAPVGDPALVALAVGESMRMREVAGEDFAVTLAHSLRHRNALVFLDNCEHVIDASASLCHALLRTCPGVVLLATSREPLGVDGETTWRVPSLEEEEAVRLFIDRAGRARPSFEVDHANADAVSQICARLDGIPLAIELAAARVRVLSPAQIAAGLDERFRLLAGGSRTAMPRQRTLEASVDWSYNLLTSEQRTLFRRLSVFAGTFALDSAEAVCSGGELDPYQVFDLLLQLTDRSLVQVENDGRYRMLETIRQYARMKLIDSGEADHVRTGHLHHYVDLVERAVPHIEQGGTAAAWLPRLDIELDNVRAAVDWASSTGNPASALRLTTAWPEYWGLTGHTVEGIARVLALMADAQPEGELLARSHVALQTMYAYGGADLAECRTHGDAGLAIARELGNARLESRARLYLGFLAAVTDPANSDWDLADARTAAAGAEDTWAEARCLIFDSIAALLRGDDVTCTESGLAAARFARERGDLINLAHGLHYGGWGHMMSGQPLAADALFQEALAVTEAVGDHMYTALLRPTVGTSLALRGEGDGVMEVIEWGLRANRDAQNIWHIGAVLMAKAMAAAVLGDPETVLEAVEEGGPTNRAMGMFFTSEVLAVAGVRAALAVDDLERARRFVLDAADDAESGVPNWVGQSRLAAALLALREGEVADATALATDAIAHFGARSSMSADALELLAGLWVREQRAGDGVRLFASADAHRRRSQLVRWKLDDDRYVSDIARARELLDAAAFDSAWAEGEALTLEEAVAFATRGRGARRRPATGWSSLTPTEVEVVRLVAEGLTNPQIGERLFIGRGTVKTHIAHVFAKTGVATRAELATEATRRGV